MTEGSPAEFRQTCQQAMAAGAFTELAATIQRIGGIDVMAKADDNAIIRFQQASDDPELSAEALRVLTAELSVITRSALDQWGAAMHRAFRLDEEDQ